MAEQTERMVMRVSPEFLATVDEWRARQRPIPTRSEAIRQLVELGAASDPHALELRDEENATWRLIALEWARKAGATPEQIAAIKGGDSDDATEDPMLKKLKLMPWKDRMRDDLPASHPHPVPSTPKRPSKPK